MRGNSIAKMINVRRKLELSDALQQRDNRRGVTSGREGGGDEIHFIPPSALSRSVRCSVPTGKEIHRDQKTGTAERRYTSLSPRRRAISSSPSFPHEFLGIPRLVTGGGDRVRFAISPTSTPPHQRQPDNQPPRIPRHRRGPKTFGDTGEEEGVGISSVSSTEATPHVLFPRWIIGYLDSRVRRYSSNRDPGLSLPGCRETIPDGLT